MKIRYKNSPEDERNGVVFYFNMQSMDEIDMGDDSARPSELEVWLEADQRWQPLREAFAARPRVLITDNYNTHFFEPRNEIDRERGYSA